MSKKIKLLPLLMLLIILSSTATVFAETQLQGSCSHRFHIAQDRHSGNKHYIVERCEYCGYERRSSYLCPGNPCILPY